MKETTIRFNWKNFGIGMAIITAIFAVGQLFSKWFSSWLIDRWPWFDEIEKEEES